MRKEHRNLKSKTVKNHRKHRSLQRKKRFPEGIGSGRKKRILKHACCPKKKAKEILGRKEIGKNKKKGAGGRRDRYIPACFGYSSRNQQAKEALPLVDCRKKMRKEKIGGTSLRTL